MPTVIAKKMVGAKVSGRAANRSSAHGRAHYVTDKQKASHVETQGFSAEDLSVKEMLDELYDDMDKAHSDTADLTSHWVMSWSKDDNAPRPDEAVQAAKELMRDLGYGDGNKIIFAIHEETDHLHCHVVACRVDMWTGKTLKEGNGWWKNESQKSLAKIADRHGWDLEAGHAYDKDGNRLSRQERRQRSIQKHMIDAHTTGASWQNLLASALDKFQEDHQKEMSNWRFGDLHRKLAELGIEVRKAPTPQGGFGLAYSLDGEHFVSASKCAPGMTYKNLVEKMGGSTWRDMRDDTRQTLEAVRAGMPPPPKAERKPRRKRQPRQEPAPAQQPDRAAQRVNVKIGNTSAHISGRAHLPKDTILVDWAAALEEARRHLKELQGPDIFAFEIKPFELSYNPDRKSAEIKPIPPEKTPWFDREAERQRVFQEQLEQNRLRGQIEENQSRAAAFRNFHEAAQKPAEQPPAPPRPRLATEREASAKPAQPARPKKASPPRKDDAWKWRRAQEQQKWMRDYFARLDRDPEDVARLDRELEEQRQINERLLRLMQERGVLTLDHTQEQQGETMEYDDYNDDAREQERLDKLDFERRLDDKKRLDDEKFRLEEERRQKEDDFFRRLEEAGVFQQAASKPESESPDAPITISNSVANDEIPASFLLDQPQPAQETEKPDRDEQEREKEREREQLNAFKKLQEEQEQETQAAKEENAAQVELHIIEQDEQAEKALGDKPSSKEEKQNRKSQLQAKSQNAQQRKRQRMR